MKRKGTYSGLVEDHADVVLRAAREYDLLARKGREANREETSRVVVLSARNA